VLKLSTKPWRHMGEWMYRCTLSDLGIVGGEWSASRPCRFAPAERAPGTHWRGGRVTSRHNSNNNNNNNSNHICWLLVRKPIPEEGYLYQGCCAKNCVTSSRRFGTTSRLHHQGSKLSQAINESAYHSW
jgi:hypothetical protein